MPRKVDFFRDHDISGLKTEYKNRRLLTTPTEDTSRKIKLDFY